MTVSFELNDVKNFVTSEEFSDFLLKNTTDFGTAAFILQTLLEKIDELEGVDEE